MSFSTVQEHFTRAGKLAKTDSVYRMGSRLRTEYQAPTSAAVFFSIRNINISFYYFFIKCDGQRYLYDYFSRKNKKTVCITKWEISANTRTKTTCPWFVPDGIWKCPLYEQVKHGMTITIYVCYLHYARINEVLRQMCLILVSKKMCYSPILLTMHRTH